MNIITKPTEAQIRARAFEIYLERGRQPGREMDDWLQAEVELQHLPFHVVHLLPLGATRHRSPRSRARSYARFSEE
jgi:hypothetical protein